MIINAGLLLAEREERMLQRFQLSLNDGGTRLNIKESAVIDHHLNMIDSSMIEDRSFCLLCEETYDNTTIAKSISVGIEDVVKTLRTVNFFPNHQCATKIAKAIVQLCTSTDGGRVELFFDDRDMMKSSSTPSVGV